MAYMKWTSIRNDTFCFIREKTKNSKSNGQEIIVHLNDVLKKIIADWSNKDKSSPYVFPILEGKTIVEMENARNRHKRVCNKSLAHIGQKLGFDVHLCLNLARHSFATALKIAGVSVSFISESMGHSSAAMTEHYMKTLPDENHREMSNK